jgi:hypothetical protein
VKESENATNGEVFRTVQFRREPRETIRPAPRAIPASDPNHDERIQVEAIAVVVHVRVFTICSRRSRPLSPPPLPRLKESLHRRPFLGLDREQPLQLIGRKVTLNSLANEIRNVFGGIASSSTDS